MNYETDDSFFTTVFPPFVYYGWSVKSWLLQDENAIFRYIRDYEIEQEFWNIGQINEIYSEIKTIAIVVNPWDRIYYVYDQLCVMKEAEDSILKDLTNVPLDNFSNFVNSLPMMPNTFGNFWFSLTTPVCRWTAGADYVLKDITFEKDFQKIQEYFDSSIPLKLREKLPSSREFYNNTTKDIVASIFKEDIEQFGYTF